MGNFSVKVLYVGQVFLYEIRNISSWETTLVKQTKIERWMNEEMKQELEKHAIERISRIFLSKLDTKWINKNKAKRVLYY